MANYSYTSAAPTDYGYPSPPDSNYLPAVSPPSADPHVNYPPANCPPPPLVAGAGYSPPYSASPSTSSQLSQTYPMPQETTPLVHGYAASHQAKHDHQTRPTYGTHNPQHSSSQTPPSQYQPAPQTTNVVVFNNQPQAVQQAVVTEKHYFNHFVHLVLTIIFPPWIFIWLLCCAIHGC